MPKQIWNSTILKFIICTDQKISKALCLKMQQIRWCVFSAKNIFCLLKNQMLKTTNDEWCKQTQMRVTVQKQMFINKFYTLHKIECFCYFISNLVQSHCYYLLIKIRNEIGIPRLLAGFDLLYYKISFVPNKLYFKDEYLS